MLKKSYEKLVFSQIFNNFFNYFSVNNLSYEFQHAYKEEVDQRKMLVLFYKTPVQLLIDDGD